MTLFLKIEKNLTLRAVKDSGARMSHLRTEIEGTVVVMVAGPMKDVPHLDMASSQTTMYSQPSSQPHPVNRWDINIGGSRVLEIYFKKPISVGINTGKVI